MQKKVTAFFFIFTKFAKCKENKTCENKSKAQILLTYKYWYIFKSWWTFFYFVIQSNVVLSQLKLKKKNSLTPLIKPSPTPNKKYPSLKNVTELMLKFLCCTFSSGNQAGDSVPGTVSVGSEAHHGLEPLWFGGVSNIQKIFRKSLTGEISTKNHNWT